MSYEIIALRFVHVVGGIFWVGSALLMTFFIAPSLGGLGPAAGALMAGLRQRGLMTWLPVVALLTILSGLRLIWIVSDGFDGPYMTTAMGHTFAGSGALAIVAFLVGILVARPAAARMGEIGAQMAAAPEAQRAALAEEMERLRRRSATTTMVNTILLLVAAAGMAVARYLG